MARSSTTVTSLAQEAGMDVDEVLITLWDEGMEYIKSPTSIIHRGDTNRARRSLGMATRRELASLKAWQSLFNVDDEEFAHILETYDIRSLEQRKLSKKDINKLRAEARLRNLSWTGEYQGAAQRAQILEPIPPLNWRVIGRERPIKYLTEDEVLAIHDELVTYFSKNPSPLDPPGTKPEPIDPPGVRDNHLLGSAISRPQTSMGDERKYPSVEMAGAALVHSLIHNHPFHNGNKRTALVAMLAFLDTNRILLTCDEHDLFKHVWEIAQHQIASGDQLPDREVLAISEWIRSNSRPIEMGDRPIPFRRLRKLLVKQECNFNTPTGSQISISRTIQEKKGWRRKLQSTELRTQIHYDDPGREVDKITIAKIRKDLQLDESNNVDSATFYDNAPAAAGEFILQFRKILHRLAKL